MVDNCNSFYFVSKGEGCTTIASDHGITFADFLRFNPAVESDCSGLWAEVNVCVGVVGFTATITTATPTSTNGIPTPTSTEPGIVDNCDAFHLVVAKDTCSDISQEYGISLDQFTTWNTQLGDDCTGLWLGYYVCVSVIGVDPTPTTVQPTTTTNNNGITTPTPTQAGMVSNCDTFHFVVDKETCETIAKLAGVDTNTFISWNPAVGSDCTGLWLSTYCCIGLI